MQDSVEIARKIAEVSSDMLASDVTVLDISEISSFADVFVVSSADNIRQLNALYRQIVEKLREDGMRPNRTEGAPDGGWMLVDYGDVIVHLLTKEQRDFYRLEDLWGDAPVLLKIQ